MKTWKHWTLVLILTVFGIIIGFTACDNGNGNKPLLCDCPNGTVHIDTPCACTGEDCNCTTEVILTYPTFTLTHGSGTFTLDFNPINLPNGITWTLTDNDGNAPHIDGVVNSSSYNPFSSLTFTQTFFKNNKQIGQQVIKVNRGGGSFITVMDASNNPLGSPDSDNPVVMVCFPSVTLLY